MSQSGASPAKSASPPKEEALVKYYKKLELPKDLDTKNYRNKIVEEMKINNFPINYKSFKKYSTSNFSYDAQRASTRLTGASTSGEKIAKVSGELQFECSPDVFSKIIADIESSPAIESISSIRLQRKEAEKKLNVRMTVDTWVIPGKSATAGGIG